MQVKQYVEIFTSDESKVNEILNNLQDYNITGETNVTESINVINAVQEKIASILGGNK